ncbi:MAG: methylmalonyl-CoA epimerase [Candidatus Dormibacteria bacterium]
MFELVDHVGLVVRDLDLACHLYGEQLGLSLYRRESLSDDRVEVAAFRVGESLVELLAPTAPDSPISKFLDKRGEGMHHIAYRVPDCAEGLRRMRELGFELLDEVPRAGFDNTLVGFVHPRSVGGVLTELVQAR